MIGSILGFSTYFTGDNTEIPDTGDQNLPDSTTVAMTAINVPAKVVQVLPKIFFSAYTDTADITVIDSRIASIEGIYSINSKYRQAPSNAFGSSLIYATEISFDKSINPEDIISKVNSSFPDILFDPVSYEEVLVNVPTTVSFSSSQGIDLNYNFEDPLILTYVSPGTLVGDELTVRIDGSFTGSTLVGSISSELNNITAQPNTIVLDENKSVSEMLPNIIFGSVVDYSDFVDENTLKQKILSLPDAVDANIDVYLPASYFIAGFDSNTDLQADFNSLVNDDNRFTSISVSSAGTGYSAEIHFNYDNAKELEEKTILFLEEKNASNISIIEAKSQAFASIELSSGNSDSFVSALTSLLDSLNFQGTEIQQKAFVSFAGETFVNSNGKEFTADENTDSSVYVSSSRKAGNIVQLKIQVRNLLLRTPPKTNFKEMI